MGFIGSISVYACRDGVISWGLACTHTVGAKVKLVLLSELSSICAMAPSVFWNKSATRLRSMVSVTPSIP